MEVWILIIWTAFHSTAIAMFDKEACITALEAVKPAKAYCLSRRYGTVIDQKS